MRRRALFLPVTVAVIQIVGTHMAAWHQGVDLTAGTLALLLAGPVLLIFRRRSPGLTAAGCAAVALTHVVAGFPPGPFVVSMAIALVLALVSGARWWAWGSAAAFAAGAAGLFQWRGSPPLFSLIWLVVLLLGAEPARAGRLHRIERHRAEAEQLKHHADLERLVIARDIHDVVAHSLSMINVQASVALHLAEKDLNPAKLLEALTNIKAGSAQSLNDVREVLSVLRKDAPRIPSQRLEQLPDLLAQLTGLTTHYSPPSSAPVWMDDAVENTIYRVVQESLTNVVRHAKASRVEVAVQLTETRAQVSVADDGIGLGLAQEGNGLRGLRERVQALGGTVTLSAGILPGTPGESMSIGVLIVDDQSLIRAGFSALLEAEADMSVLGTAGSGTEAVQLARATKPDVVLMDIRMPHGDGISATAQITADLPTRVIMLTTFELEEYILDSIRAGASGFLVKDTEPAQLIEAVRIVAAGDSLLSPSVTRTLLSQVAAGIQKKLPNDPRLAELTAREREVLVQIGTGKTNAEIAAELFITPLTAKTHVSRIIGKLGVRDRTSLVVLAYESGLIAPG